MKSRFTIYLALVVALTAAHSAHADEVTGTEFIQSFLKTHCVRCHNADQKKGKVVLDSLKLDVGTDRTRFAQILEVLSAGDMPPEREPQPSLDDFQRVIKDDQVEDGSQGLERKTDRAKDNDYPKKRQRTSACFDGARQGERRFHQIHANQIR